MRGLYVAATRARDLLVVPTCGDQPIQGWLDVLDPMVYTPDDARRHSQPASSCPTFGDDSVVERGPQGGPPAHGSVRPGLHRPTADGPPVVWWDPAALSLQVEKQAPLRHQRILQADPDGTRGRRARRATLPGKASYPSTSVRTVTSLVRAAAAEASATEIEAAEAGPGLDQAGCHRGGDRT